MHIALSFYNKSRPLQIKVHFLISKGLILCLHNCCYLKFSIKRRKDIFLIITVTEMRKVIGLITKTNLSLLAFFIMKSH